MPANELLTSRRRFIGRTGLAAAAVTVSPLTKAVATPIERRRFGQIGVGGNGTRSVPVVQQFCDVVAFCDVDARHLGRANVDLAGGKADTYADYREVLARSDIDVVGISTPDHWHTKILVEAMLAGKDVYCEKPLTLTIDEGKLIRRVQRETGRIVQVGTQQRSTFGLFNTALAIIADGRLGKLKRITAGIDRGGWSPEIPIADVPEGLDWDRWLGPAPDAPFRYKPTDFVQQNGTLRNYTNGHTHFRWWYETSGGKLTDWGAHHVDIAMLGIAAAGQNSDPVSVDGTAEHAVDFNAGEPTRSDRYNTAHKFDLNVEFADGDVELRITSETDNGLLFEGDRGRIFVNRGKLVGRPVEDLAGDPLPEDALSRVYRGMPVPTAGEGRPNHWENFAYAMERRIDPISDVHSHMKMLNVCHLAGICCRLGRKIHWDQATETITGDPQAAAMMSRPYREGYEIDLG